MSRIIIIMGNRAHALYNEIKAQTVMSRYHARGQIFAERLVVHVDMHVRQDRQTRRYICDPLQCLIKIRMRWVRRVPQRVDDESINPLQRFQCFFW